MFRCFDALGDNGATERGCQTNDPFNDGQIAEIPEHVADEALVNLEYAGREPSQIGQRRIACTEVVEGEADTERLTLIDQLGYLGHSFERSGFYDLQFQSVRLDFGISGQLVAQLRKEIVLLEVVGRDVDTDDEVEPLSFPCGHLRQRSSDYPLTDTYRQFAALDQWQEFAGG